MSNAAKLYVSAVIAGGGIVLPWALSNWSSSNPLQFGIFLALAMIASLVKLRLHGIIGTYSLSFFFILIGISHFSLPETLVAACAGALVQTALNSKQRPTLVQIGFNMANLILSIAVCYLAASRLFTAGPAAYRPVALALVVFLYFTVNTVLVSGVLSLLQGKPLMSVWEEWYVWSFPYYLIGAGVVGLLPLSGQSISPTAWMFVLPVLYLVHFFHGLSVELHRNPAPERAEEDEFRLPPVARVYVGIVVGAGVLLLAWGLIGFESDDLARFLGFLAISLLTSIWKVALPRMTGTISVNFVVLLAAMGELRLPEVMILAGTATLVQSLWQTECPPKPVQVVFNMAALVVSIGLAYAVFHGLHASTAGDSLAFVLFAATATLYSANTIIVSAAVCLAESLPLNTVWQGCCFWSFPYYVVGAVFAGLMITTSQSSGWPISFLVLPLMALVYISYRLHVGNVDHGQPTIDTQESVTRQAA